MTSTTDRRRWLAVVAALATAILCACHSEQALQQSSCAEDHFRVGQMAIVPFPYTVVVDGELDEVAWKKPVVHWNTVGARDGVQGADDDQDLSLRYAMAADQQHLYFAIRATDDQVQIDARAEPWCTDAVELLIDADAGKNQSEQTACSEGSLLDCNDGQFILPLRSAGRRVRGEPYVAPFTEVGPWHLRGYAARLAPGGYTMEVALERRLPYPITLQEDTVIGVSVGAYDSDRESVDFSCDVSRIHWAAASRVQPDPERHPALWGAATLCARPDGVVPAEPAVAPVVDNDPPEVRLVYPTPGSEIVRGSQVSLLATATDEAAGEVYRVTFLVRSLATGEVTRIGHDTRRPFGYLWQGVSAPAGEHELIALATDNRGAVTWSDPVAIRVVDDPGQPRWRIGFVGDGLTLGDRSRDSYRRLLWQQLQQPGIQIDFWGRFYLAADGLLPPNPDFDLNHDIFAARYLWRDVRRSIGWPSDLQLVEQLQNRLAQSSGRPYDLEQLWRPLSPHHMLVMLGQNDIRDQWGVDDIEVELRRTIATIRQRLNPTATIFLAKVPAARGLALLPLNERIAQLASELSTDNSPVVLVDQFTGFLIDLHTDDGATPNAAGQQLISERWAEALKPYLSGLPPPSITPWGGSYREEVSVLLSHELPQAELHYTIDGSEPDRSSTLYAGALRLTAAEQPLTLKVRAFSPLGQSRVVSTTFDIRDDTSPPAVRAVLAYDPLRVLVQFDEPLDPQRAVRPTNYKVDGVDSVAVALQPSGDAVLLGLAKPLTPSTLHSLLVAFVADTATPQNLIALGQPSTPFRLQSSGEGLLAQYFDDSYLGQPVASRIEPRIDNRWGPDDHRPPTATCAEQPGEGACPRIFSVRWSGQLRPPDDGTYTFKVETSGWVRLWIEGEPLLSSPGFVEGVLSGAAPQQLRRDTVYPIRLDYAAAEPLHRIPQVRLMWRSAELGWQTVPQQALYTAIRP